MRTSSGMRARSPVLNEDDRLDSLKTQVFRDLLTHMLQNQSTVEPSLDLILVSRHLERIGDHATNIAEDVIFMVSALDVRHHLTSALTGSNEVCRAECTRRTAMSASEL